MDTAARSRAGHTGGFRARVAVGCVALALAATGCTGAADESSSGSAPTTQRTSPGESAPVSAPAAAARPTPSAEPLLTSTPDEQSEVGELVKGFPDDLLPVPRDAVILVTSAIPVGDADVQEVSLNLKTSLTAQDLLAMYRTALVEAGFTEAEPSANPQTGLAVESVFTRSGGDELVSIGVLDADGARTVTIGGRIHTTP